MRGPKALQHGEESLLRIRRTLTGGIIPRKGREREEPEKSNRRGKSLRKGASKETRIF